MDHISLKELVTDHNVKIYEHQPVLVKLIVRRNVWFTVGLQSILLIFFIALPTLPTLLKLNNGLPMARETLDPLISVFYRVFALFSLFSLFSLLINIIILTISLNLTKPIRLVYHYTYSINVIAFYSVLILLGLFFIAILLVYIFNIAIVIAKILIYIIIIIIEFSIKLIISLLIIFIFLCILRSIIG